MIYICKQCKIEFSAYSYLKRQYCSAKCWRSYKVAHGLGKNTGYKHSEESKRKNSQANKGKVSWNKGLKGYNAGAEHWAYNKKRPEMTGENNPNWKGGVSKDRRFNQDYKIWRSRVFARDNYICQICDATGVYIQADHIKSYAKFPNLRYSIDNGRTLCVPCHYYVTFKRKMPAGIVWGTNKRISKF